MKYPAQGNSSNNLIEAVYNAVVVFIRNKYIKDILLNDD